MKLSLALLNRALESSQQLREGSTPDMDVRRGAASPGANQRRCVSPSEGGGKSPPGDLDSGAKARGAGGVRL
ncbi:hypothetical protein LPW36_08455 [Jinshanibacter sp. LJY008]|uniref:Uncharacterized protein n=1 Tax=Limnobaculum eriocheiris TaxID=2897391 RepID=A0A9X1MXK0_9GAMM|nr:hypothetical protein [Limnobaculum eriocheiris]MCD1126030.1 hypothetical protein [Limnobaculum eriocheiris]